MRPTPPPVSGGALTTRLKSTVVATLTLAAVAAVAAGAAWVGRTGSDPSPASPTTPLVASGTSALPQDARTLLDGGNAAFRAGRYEAALAHYRAAAQRDPVHVAPWYGVHMAAEKLGRATLADSALAAIRQRTGAPAGWEDAAVRRAHERAPARTPGGP